MQAHQQQRLFFLMMLARMQSQQPTYPVMMGNMSIMAYPYPMPYPSAPPANVPMPAAVKNEAPALPLLAGITDAQGHVAWPLGLQILRPALETKELRQQIESSLVGAAQQAASGGRAAEPMVAGTRQAVARLRQALRDQRVEMAEATYRDAAAFLDRIHDAIQAIGEGKGAY